ncbi:MAG: hypothetical protein M3014_08665, partial [Chloroflexota bacterium]|nr:hypothetical protein [Chloroflexota bacterium]
MVAALASGDTLAGAGGVRFSKLAIDPAGYNFFVWGEAGVWGARYDPAAYIRGVKENGFAENILCYEAFGRPVTTTVALPPGAMEVVAVGAQGRK